LANTSSPSASDLAGLAIVDVETLAQLRTPDGRALLDEAIRAYGDEDAFALGTRLRRTHPPELVAAALTQARLRRRARAKFDLDDAGRMLFTVNGLEQATRANVSKHRAERIAQTLVPSATAMRETAVAAGVTPPVADLCCGIGGDLIALARAGLAVTAVDTDPLTAAVARANIEELGLGAPVINADATTIDRTPFAAVICDPARRTDRGRVFNPDAYQPPWSFVEELLSGSACVKVAPGIPHDLVPSGVEAEWVSDGGEVKEAALWSGELRAGHRSASSGTPLPSVRRRATLLPSGATVTDAEAPPDPPIAPPGRWLIEPDGAVIRAGLVTAVAAAAAGWLLDPQIAYVSCDTEPHTELGRSFEIVDQLPYDIKRLRAYVRNHGIGILTIKKRGVGLDPAQLRRHLRPHGDAEATFVITRLADRATTLVVTPRKDLPC
jgi:hypothetical protein